MELTSAPTAITLDLLLYGMSWHLNISRKNVKLNRNIKFKIGVLMGRIERR